MRMRLVLVLCAALALTVGVSTAAAGHGHGKGKGGNSAAAHACQHGGYKNFVRSDGTSFKNTGACVSYAAHGGTLVAKTRSQLDCESLGGTFSTNPATDLLLYTGTVVWTCNNTTGNPYGQPLTGDCTSDGGTFFAAFQAVPYAFPCYKP
jgi:hypothetical protein